MSTLQNLISRKVVVFWFIPCCQTVDLDQTEKRNTAISQMRLRSVFKMRTSILNTVTTEQMGYGIISFFVYIKSTNQYFLVSNAGLNAQKFRLSKWSCTIRRLSPKSSYTNEIILYKSSIKKQILIKAVILHLQNYTKRISTKGKLW